MVTDMRRAGVTAMLALAGAVTVLGALILPVTPAHADDEAVGTISRMDITADLAAEGGRADVTVDLRLDLGSEEAHGPYLVLAELQEIVGDPDHYRRFEIDDVTAHSQTAPDDLRVEHEDGVVGVYVGDEDTEITGAHDYRITYTVTGLVNPAEAGGEDELYWNVVAPGGFEIPIDELSVAISGPVAPERSACYVGPTGSTDPCADVTTDGRTVHASTTGLGDGEGVSVVVGWPGGTFTGAEPELVHRYTPANVVQLTPVTGGITAAAVLAALAGIGVLARTRGRDRAYLGLTPGLTPAGDAPGTVGPAPQQSVAVRFTPPDGVRPGEVGTLADEIAHRHDVTATIVDLAVRGYLRIEEVAGSEPDDGPEDADSEVDEASELHGRATPEPGDWRLVQLRTDTDHLEAYEAALLDRLFADDEAPLLSDLGGKLHETVSATSADLYTTVVERGWFTASPQKVRHRWIARGAVVLGLGAISVPVLWLTQLPLVFAFAPLAVGVALMVASASMPARTAAGTAVLAQALGFREYLATAEAEQLRFEEGEDVFSRYLPWAIVFGLADRWAQIVADAAARGMAVPEPAWYVGLPGVHVWAGSDRFAASVGAFTTTAVTAASVGAGGGSGFTGGTVGAGVGGTGGGSW